MLRYWPVLFFIIPLVEVYFLIQVGSVIGAGWTILLVVLTAVIGVNLLRQQGVSTLMRANQAMSRSSTSRTRATIAGSRSLFLAISSKAAICSTKSSCGVGPIIMTM